MTAVKHLLSRYYLRKKRMLFVRCHARIAGARALLPMMLVTAASCGLARSVEDVKAIPVSDSQFDIEAPCSVASTQAVVEAAAKGLELAVKEAPNRPGEPWILFRGARLYDGPLYYRVDVEPAAAPKQTSMIRVFAIPWSGGVGSTGETISKPCVLAMRIVAACAAGGVP